MDDNHDFVYMVDTADEEEEASSPRPRRSAFRRLLPVILVVAFGAFLAFGVRSWTGTNVRTAEPAPPFEFTSFDGEPVNLADLQGQGVVLNFWASWCGPCRAEAELLEQAWRQEEANGIVFVGINYQDNEESALQFLDAFDVTYPNGPDIRNLWARTYDIQGIPATFFIGPDGTLQSQVQGAILSTSSLENHLAQIRP
jgi:cytochrome c biogenesis protein CcmG/thiol:disulfide interchange protein DsbE